MITFDFYVPGARPHKPTAPQVLKRWREAGRPDQFMVLYGDGNVEFSRWQGRDTWDSYGYANFKVVPIQSALRDACAKVSA
jgi:hypothetical protein